MTEVQGKAASPTDAASVDAPQEAWLPTGYDDILAVLESLPVIVRETRRRKRQSLREAAEQAAVSFSTLSRCETRSGDPSLSSVCAVLRWAAT